jgi:hypothetical protein
MTLLGFVIALFSLLGVSSYSGFNVFPISAVNPEYRPGLILSAFVILFVPLIALVLFAIRVIFNRRVVTKTSSFAMLVIWLTGIGFGIHFGSKLASEFRDGAIFSKSSDLKPSPVYFLKLNDEKFLTKEDSIQNNLDAEQDKFTVIIDGDEDYRFNPDKDNIRLHFERSNIDKPELVVEYQARGRDFQSAFKTAKRITYSFKQIDSTLYFDKNLHIRDTELWRNQEVKLTLKIPENTRLVIDNQLNRFLYNFDLGRCIPEGAPYFETPSNWIMAADGMKCAVDSLNHMDENKENE